jgi:hypothetical protein
VSSCPCPTRVESYVAVTFSNLLFCNCSPGLDTSLLILLSRQNCSFSYLGLSFIPSSVVRLVHNSWMYHDGAIVLCQLCNTSSITQGDHSGCVLRAKRKELMVVSGGPNVKSACRGGHGTLSVLNSRARLQTWRTGFGASAARDASLESSSLESASACRVTGRRGEPKRLHARRVSRRSWYTTVCGQSGQAADLEDSYYVSIIYICTITFHVPMSLCTSRHELCNVYALKVSLCTDLS